MTKLIGKVDMDEAELAYLVQHLFSPDDVRFTVLTIAQIIREAVASHAELTEEEKSTSDAYVKTGTVVLSKLLSGCPKKLQDDLKKDLSEGLGVDVMSSEDIAKSIVDKAVKDAMK